MHVKVNSAQVVRGTITLPIAGPWTAIVEADSDEAVSSPAILSIADALTFRGTAERSGAVLGRARARIVGGGGGLRSTVAGFAYYEAPLSVIVGDLLAAVGETLSDLSDAAVLATVPRHWVRAAGTARDELDTLADWLEFSWRLLPNGETWIGEETWPVSPLSMYVMLDDAREDGRVEIAAEVPMVLPGETFLNQHVNEVVHVLEGSLFRTTVKFGNSALGNVQRVIDARLAKLDTHAHYPGTVVQQTADGLDVELDDDRFGIGITRLSIAYGLPGITADIPKGTRCEVGFHEGRRDKPIVHHWIDGNPTNITIDASTKIKFGGSASRGVARLGDTAGPYVITSASTKVEAE